MNKLPVLFVSCNVESLKAQEPTGSGAVRMVWGNRYDSVVVISAGSDIVVPEVFHFKGKGDSTEQMRLRLKAQGFVPEVRSEDPQSRESLLQLLLTEKPDELAELRLATGMNELDYRQIGQSLAVLREQGVLVVCLDDQSSCTDRSKLSLHDRHFREVINGWVQDQQWNSAISFNGGHYPKTQTTRVDDPTTCLLNTAFTLGGSRSPQRVFGSDMNNAAKMLSGLGWVR